MLNKPFANNVNKNAVYVNTFGGINERLIIGDSEFSEAVNMSDSDFPALSVRKEFTSCNASGKFAHINSIAINNDVLYALDTAGNLFYKDRKLETGIASNKLLRTGNMLYAYPDSVTFSLPSNENDDIKISKGKYTLNICNDNSKLSENDFFTYNINYNFTAFFVMLNSIHKTFFCSESAINNITNPKYGDYLSTINDSVSGVGHCTLRMWGKTASGEDKWITVEPDGTLLTFCNQDVIDRFDEIITAQFKPNDAIYVGGGTLGAEKSYLIHSICKNGGIYRNMRGIAVNGLIDGIDHLPMSGSDALYTIKKKTPKLNFVIANNNRLWSCYCGYDDDGNLINEICATAQGTTDGWYSFDGSLMQAFAVSVTEDGDFTGIGTISGYPAFFKEKCIYKMYGNNPSNYSLQVINCPGVKKGCENSICVINGITYYMSDNGIMAIRDGYPSLISDKIDLSDAKNVTCSNINEKLYVTFAKGLKFLTFVFNPKTEIWHSINATNISASNELNSMSISYFNDVLCAFSINGELAEARKRYYENILATGNLADRAQARLVINTKLYIADIDSAGKLVFFGDKYKIPTHNDFVFKETVTEDIDEMKWEVVTGAFGYSYTNFKVPSSVGIRILLEAGSNCNIEAEYDSNGIWEYVDNLVGDERTCVRFVNMKPYQCDHFRLKLSGIGKASIVSMTIKYAQGGSNNYD